KNKMWLNQNLNEKTLEINVNADILRRFRRNARFRHSFIYGFSQYYESRNGLDTSFNLPGSLNIVSFQFKAPIRSSRNVFFFEFNNNDSNDQHNLLYLTAVTVPYTSTVFYALPAFSDINHFANSSPRFLEKTFFIDILDTPPIHDGHRHQFEIDTVNNTFTIHSKKILDKGKLLSWKDITAKIKTNKAGVKSKIFLQHIKSKLEQDLNIEKKFSVKELIDTQLIKNKKNMTSIDIQAFVWEG
ncbi:MAG: hypothetical protein ACKO7N_10090, partial [Candidatus Nitrosotenuis sp.]